ncbi:MAG TPA: hypothetical protein VE172_08985 [Stackebrandtia sp.]|jgi:DNA-binding protein YbaB|uniref:hypothetical protein n=1 Tax=Stackebrandtia sp. TaxID=2023065 RepID=UPI002D3DB5BC|nr:hypothetical protein [Stackebrandtia sp.]HZE38931.1 hypothetical protein [Stackebrandtia sp.]
MSHRDAVIALRQQIRDASAAVDGGGLARALGEVHFVTTGGRGDIRVLMSANRTLIKMALRPGTLDRHDRERVARGILRTIQEAESVLHDALDSLKETRACA